MFNSNSKTIDTNLQILVKDAQAVLREASALTGAKAEEVRTRGMHLLDKALAKAQDIQAATTVAGKEMAASADSYVKENPWRTMAAAAGAGMLLGIVLGRK